MGGRYFVLADSLGKSFWRTMGLLRDPEPPSVERAQLELRALVAVLCSHRVPPRRLCEALLHPGALVVPAETAVCATVLHAPQRACELLVRSVALMT